MSFRLANLAGTAALVDDQGGLHPLDLDPMTALADADTLHERANQLDPANATAQLDDVTLDPPVPAPRSVFAIGLNYADHIAESNLDAPAVPLVFTKFPGCIVGPADDIVLESGTVDYEAELVVVIGRDARNVAAADAWSVIAGVTAGQDISDRALQFAAAPPHFDLGKSRDTYGPIGPVVVSPDLLPDRDSLGITCDVNDDRRQDGSSSDLIFDVAAIIEYISSILTLRSGDIIFTGTPAGVGMATGAFLQPGDVITTTIEGIGALRNVCR